ncbi:MAG: YihY/virulence factor BrkB family protein [Lachnospiraceae bacterium]|nr:YihY/virulence factor BrkB family protein [Lachnospiraceae bacterium]
MKIKDIPVLSGLDAFGKRVGKDAVAAYAGETALFIIISFFPFVMFLLSLFRFLPFFSEEDLVRLINLNLPEVIAEPVLTILDEIYATSSTFMSVSVISLVWAASRGMLSIIRGLNSVYQIPETRNYLLVRLLSVFYMLIFTAIILLTLGLSVFGTTIRAAVRENIPDADRYFSWLRIIDFRVVLTVSVLFVFFLLFFKFVPNRKTKLIYEVPGALITSVGWTAFSHIYSFYIRNLSNYTYMYGSLAAIVFLVLWLYFCFYIMFIGAEVSSLIREYYPDYYRFFKK